jgi:tripartite-type tricarboxylate transporter receptor subunit TctC
MHKIHRRGFLKIAAASAAMPSLKMNSAFAQAWPNRHVRIIVPYAAGGAIDITARMLGGQLSDAWKQPVIIENMVGAGGNLGADAAAKSPPDGYTIFLAAVGFAVNKFLYTSLKYDPTADFAPVSLLTLQPNVMVVPNSSPAKTVKEFIDYAKAAKATFASSGVGTSMHLCGEMFKRSAGIEMTHVPYRGSAQVINDLIPGRVDVNFDSISAVWPHVQSGQLRGLAVTTTTRTPFAPDLPTIAETGIPGFDVAGWVGAFMPAHAPPELVDRINKDMVAALQKPDVKGKLESLGAVVTASTPGGLAGHLKSEMDKWGPVIRDANIKLG